MSKGRKIGGEIEARRSLRAAEAAGLEPREWAHEHGVDARSLNMWRVILRRTASKGARPLRQSTRVPSAATGLVELVPTSPARVVRPLATVAPARYVLDVGGARIEFGDDFATPTLRRVIEVLRSC